jgi:hypothetical protein
VAQQFQANLHERLGLLDAMAKAIKGDQLTADLQTEAQATAHRLTGSLSTFGYGSRSDTMRAIEHLLSHPVPLQPKQAQRFMSLLTTLRQQLNQPPRFESHSPASHGMPHLLIVDGDAGFTQALSPVAGDMAFFLRVAPDLATDYQHLAKQVPDAIVVNLGATAPQMETLAFLADFTTDFPNLPLVVLADHDTLTARTAVIPCKTVCG